MRELILKTSEGYLVKVDLDRASCMVTTPSGEVESGPSGVWQVVPTIVFIGGMFRLEVADERYVLLDVLNSKIGLPYRIVPGRRVQILSLPCRSSADQFPVYVRLFPRVVEALDSLRRGVRPHFFVLDSAVIREDMLLLRKSRPEVRCIVARSQNIFFGGIPGGDRLDSEGLGGWGVQERGVEISKNPVFLARLHLREFNLDMLKGLLSSYPVTLEEVEFIRVFIQMALRNKSQDPEIRNRRQELENVNELYRLSAILLGGSEGSLDEELDRGIDPKVAADLAAVVEVYRNKVSSKEEEIRYWEWEYRLKKVAGGGKSA